MLEVEGRAIMKSSVLLGVYIAFVQDWPPSTDFKTAFPELFEDFSRAVPVPNYVRRDGTLNIASHFPANTISPDLGEHVYIITCNIQLILYRSQDVQFHGLLFEEW